MDLANYICPFNGHKFVLGGLGNENCQSVLMPDGWVEFRKNKHYEALRVDQDYIYRGEDTSLISKDGVSPVGVYYTQYELVNGVPEYGAKWIKRNMNKGESFDRDVYIIYRDYKGDMLYAYQEKSRITFKDFYPTYKFQSGITLNNVIELQWGGEEVYLYAENYGLVGWRNIRTGKESSYIISQNGVTMTPFPIPTKRPSYKRFTIETSLDSRVLSLLNIL